MTPTTEPDRIGILAIAQPRNGGTLPYTLSMIDALRRLPASRYAFTIFTTVDNSEYDHLGLPLVKLPSPARFVAGRLTGSNPFAEVDKLIAPVYSTFLLTSGKPFVFTLHDLQEKYFPEHFGLATRLWRHVTNALLTARAQRIICESRFVRDDITRYFGVPEDRITVVPAPPVSTLTGSVATAEEAAAVRAKYGLPRDFVFYPAQFWPHKNHLRLVTAFAEVAKRHPACGLVLTGQKRLEYDKVMARAAALGITDRIYHVGHVTQAEVSALYKAATVVAVPTLFESISLPIYEAFFVGTALCASNVVALPEQVGDAGLLFDPLSTDDIARTLDRLLASPNLRARLTELGRARILSVTHDDYARNLAGILDGVGAITLHRAVHA